MRPGEAAAAAELQAAIGRLERAPTGKVDFVVVDGLRKGQTVDFFITSDSPIATMNLNKYFVKNWPKVEKGLLEHLKKADIVPLDFRVLTPANQSIVLKYLATLPEHLRVKAIILEF